MIKLIAIDLDGTLINHRGDITERTLEVLEEAHRQQICLALCTGRTYIGAEKIIHQLKLIEKGGYFCGMNGQEIYSFKSNETVRFPDINAQDVQKLLDISLKYPLLCFVYSNDICYIAVDGKYKLLAGIFGYLFKMLWIFRQNDQYKKIIIVDAAELMDITSGKLCFFSAEFILKKLKNKIEEQLPDIFHSVSVRPVWMETQYVGINKGEALKIIAKMENISTSEIIAFGDGENDISMLKTVGVAVAVQNAMSRVKVVADDICPSNQKDGVANYLSKHILSKNKL